MVRSLQEYVTETTKSYEPAKKAIQEQIDAISGQLAETEKNINNQFAVQQQTLDNQRQTAAANASMQAAGSGGSFGGQANIANRNFYRDAYVPAVTQLQTNQQQSLSDARSASEKNRLSLASQLANLLTQANTSALSRYDADSQLETQIAAQEAQLAKQLAAQEAQQAKQLAEQARQFNENLAWERDKLAQQLADSAKTRAASSANTTSLSNYIKELANVSNKTAGNSNISQYYSQPTQTAKQTAQPAYVTGANGKAVYNFASGNGGTPTLQSVLATDPAVMAQKIKQDNINSLLGMIRKN